MYLFGIFLGKKDFTFVTQLLIAKLLRKLFCSTRHRPLIACVGFPLRSNLEFGKPPIRRRASPYLQNKQEKSLNDESLEMNVAISRKKLSRKYAIQRCTGNGNVQIRNSGNFQFEGELRHSCKINTNLV